jgi:hypothetical protein
MESKYESRDYERDHKGKHDDNQSDANFELRDKTAELTFA